MGLCANCTVVVEHSDVSVKRAHARLPKHTHVYPELEPADSVVCAQVTLALLLGRPQPRSPVDRYLCNSYITFDSRRRLPHVSLTTSHI